LKKIDIAIKDMIDEAYERDSEDQERLYIGASGIGNACSAAIAFGFRGFPETPPKPRTKRIFRDGRRIEWDVIKDLKKAKVNVLEVDPLTGKQWEHRTCGHIIGHADGLIEGAKGSLSLLEIKSMNDARWKKCIKEGVKFSDRHYYDQVQLMMGMALLDDCHFLFYNKNTSDYGHEVISFSEFDYEALLVKAEAIMQGDVQRIAETEDDWRCRGCFRFDACWCDELPKRKTMRSCANSVAEHDGSWSCANGCTAECREWEPWRPKDRS
jgi:hypothetical protein